MKKQTSGMFPVLWVAAAMLFIGLVPQLRADEHAAPDESGWGQTNGPYSGEILALYAAPKGVLFVGTEGAGIFRSTDRGDTWTPVNTGLRFEPKSIFWSVTAFAQKGNVLYAGTRDGLYTSSDAGTTWHHVLSFQEYASISGLVVAPISGLVVIRDRIYVGTTIGVWYSDDGNLWIPVNDGLTSRIPGRDRFAMSIDILSKAGTTLVAGTRSGVFRKRDNEASWTAINVPFDEPSGVEWIYSFAAIGNLMYGGGHRGFRGGYSDEARNGIFRSDDEGDTWTRITAKGMTNTVEALAVYGGTLYASSGSVIYRSDDKGDSWTIVNDGLTDGTVSTLLAVNEDTVYVGTSGDGVFRTTDGGDSWMESNAGITNATVSELEIIGNRIYAQMGKRIFIRLTVGNVARCKNTCSPDELRIYRVSRFRWRTLRRACGSSRHHPDEVVGGIYRLDKENNAWVELTALRNLTGSMCIGVFGTTFYIGTRGHGVFQWEQGWDPWAINLGLENHSITALSGNGETVYAGADGDEIYRLNKGQWEWEPIHLPEMVGSYMSDLRWVGSTLYATFWEKGVFRSRDGGDSWTAINEGLNETLATTIGTDGTEVYIGTLKGVCQWSEDGKQWELIGFLPYHVRSLAVLEGFLYAGTAGGGVYKIRIEN